MRLGRVALASAALGMAIVAALVILSRAKPPLVTVEQLIAHHAEFDGRRIRVRGFLSECRDETCVLASKPLGSGGVDAWEKRGGKALSIAYDPLFDRATSGFKDRPVVFEAVFSDLCRQPPPKPGWKIICIDRAAELTPNTHSLLLDGKF
jgi:hypothetical protein